MSTIDKSGNIHHGAGTPGGGQFAGKSNTAPAGALQTDTDVTEPPAEFYRVWDGPEESAREAFARATWTALAEPASAELGAAIQSVGAEEALRIVLDATVGDKYAAESLGVSSALVNNARSRAGLAKTIFAEAERSGLRVLTAAEGGIPSQFADLGDAAPLALWVRGSPAALESLPTGLSIVGTAAATSYGEHLARELAATAVGHGQTVVSGGSYGIDGAAHRAAQTAGGTTVAILANGADRDYPSGSTGLLAGVVASGGAVISELPPGASPTKWRLISRERLIAAATPITLVVEAEYRDRSIGTAHRAAELGRVVAAVPGPVTSAASAGSNALIRDGVARLVANSDDLAALTDAARTGA